MSDFESRTQELGPLPLWAALIEAAVWLGFLFGLPALLLWKVVFA